MILFAISAPFSESTWENWLFSVLQCPFLHKRSLRAKFVSNIPYVVVEGISRTVAGSAMRSLGQILTTFCYLDFAVVLDSLWFFVFVFFLLLASDDFLCNSHPFLWECTILLSCDWPYVLFMCVIFFNDGCHLYTIYKTFTVSLLFCFITSELYFICRSYIFARTLLLTFQSSFTD